jgi:uncharacterized protein with PIN domain
MKVERTLHYQAQHLVVEAHLTCPHCDGALQFAHQVEVAPNQRVYLVFRCGVCAWPGRFWREDWQNLARDLKEAE